VNTSLNNQKIEALDGLLKEILKETDKAIYTVFHTIDKQRDGYDCLAIQYSKATGEKTKRMFFEAAISIDNGIECIEKKKFEQMKELVGDPARDKIYYVNFGLNKTFVFDLLKIETEKKLEFVDYLPTLESTSHLVAWLMQKDGTAFDYIYIRPEMEAFPKDEPVVVEKINPEVNNNQSQTDVIIEQIVEQIRMDNVSLDENGEVTFETLEEFQSYPTKIQWRCVMERHLRLNLRPNESKNELIAKYGDLEKVHKFVKERARILFLAKYGIVEETNKFEIK